MAVFPLVLLVRAVNVLEYPFSAGIAILSRTRWLAVAYSVGLGVNLASNFLLVPSYGMKGTAAAWLIGWGTNIAILAALGQRIYPLDYEWRWLLLAIAPWILIVLGYDGFVQILSRMDWPIQGGLAAVILLAGTLFLARYWGRFRSQDAAQ